MSYEGISKNTALTRMQQARVKLEYARHKLKTIESQIEDHHIQSFTNKSKAILELQSIKTTIQESATILSRLIFLSGVGKN